MSRWMRAWTRTRSLSVSGDRFLRAATKARRAPVLRRTGRLAIGRRLGNLPHNPGSEAWGRLSRMSLSHCPSHTIRPVSRLDLACHLQLLKVDHTDEVVSLRSDIGAGAIGRNQDSLAILSD